MNDVKERQGLNRAEHFSLITQCFLVSMNEYLFSSSQYSHVLSLDHDELLLPVSNQTLPEMLKSIVKGLGFNDFTGFVFPTAWYFDEWGPPRNNRNSQFYVNHTARTTIGFYNQPKSIFKTSDVLIINWHSVVENHEESKFRYSNMNVLDYKKFGYIHHFRRSCIEKFYKAECDDKAQHMEHDVMLGKYRGSIVERVRDAFN